ncbi:MAG: Uma2 family endonuclease [Eubacterium sp.]|nr:Uma2 family endonuclease [Eubacterium sp.]
MKIEALKHAKLEKGYSYDELSQLSGVPVSTIQKIFNGITKAPRYRTLQSLEKVLSDKTDQISKETRYDSIHSSQDKTVREGASAYGAWARPGKYTIENYLNLPDDRRAELIDGVFYDMSAPKLIHQAVEGELFMAFRNFVDTNQGSCKVFIPPCGVQLDQDDKTVVEPDLVVVCDSSKLSDRFVAGAPDLIIEVLSPSTRRKDMYLKTQKYEAAGVREYWMVDIDSRRVIVYVFADPSTPVIYGFDDCVPVAIWDGKCQIDMRKVWKAVQYLVK